VKAVGSGHWKFSSRRHQRTRGSWKSMWLAISSEEQARSCTKRMRSNDGSMFKDAKNYGNGKPSIKVCVDWSRAETGY
jgi:hypothetical protein